MSVDIKPAYRSSRPIITLRANCRQQTRYSPLLLARRRGANTRITISAKNGVSLIRNKNCLSETGIRETDFTYLKVTRWGWYYPSTVRDVYSRDIVAFKLCTAMGAVDVTAKL